MLNGLKDRMFNISSSAKRIILISGAAVLVLVAAILTVCVCAKQVVIVDGGNQEKQVITFKRYVENILEAEGIALGSNDKMNVAASEKLKDDMRIEIYRAFPVIVTEKGVSRELIATRRTAGEALKELGYEPKETDKITPGFNDEISDFSEITLVRVEEKVLDTTEELPYESKEVENKALASGKKRLVQKGSTGEKKVSYRVRYEDGIEVSREVLSEEVTVEPIAQIKEVGSKKVEGGVVASAGTVQTSRSGSLAYSKVVTATATAYDASSCGKSASHPGYGVTATGAKAVYGVVAVDPKVIPLGSRLYIESADGSYVYGTAVAADTGSAIKGNRVDLCFNTRSEALSFGRRTVKIYVLK